MEKEVFEECSVAEVVSAVDELCAVVGLCWKATVVVPFLNSVEEDPSITCDIRSKPLSPSSSSVSSVLKAPVEKKPCDCGCTVVEVIFLSFECRPVVIGNGEKSDRIVCILPSKVATFVPRLGVVFGIGVRRNSEEELCPPVELIEEDIGVEVVFSRASGDFELESPLRLLAFAK